MSFSAIAEIFRRAVVTCWTSAGRSDLARGSGGDSSVVIGMGLGSVGGGEGDLNKVGRPGRASRQLGESERFGVEGEA